jgi:hypothetical protein
MVAQTRRLDYAKIKADAAQRRRDASRLGRDIGEIPAIRDPKLRARCDRSLQAFCEELFPERFKIAWSKDHLLVLDLMERTIREGGRHAVAMPRGNGKTSIAECGGLWATMTGIHRFVMLVGAAGPAADAILENMKAELATNERLAAVYPGVCYPIQALEGEARRAKGQLHHGQRTHIQWSDSEVRFGMIPGERASGAVIQTAGIEGNIRGRRVVLPSGESVRPSLAILDDVQTDESAFSLTQCESRRRSIEGSVAGLAGPGQQTSMILPCTVIRRGDLADTLLDRKQNPVWRGIRTKMLDAFPENDDLWEQYAQIRSDSLLEHENISLATAFYAKHRAKMDKGAKAAWPERFDAKAGEISAIQHAMNKKLDDEIAFFAEFQNEPLDESAGEDVQLSAADIRQRTNGLPRYRLPDNTEHLTAFIDVQGKVLFFEVMAWSERFGGAVVDYGTFPDQGRSYFTLREAKKTLARNKPGAGEEAQIYAGLEQLTNDLCGREWLTADGTPARLELCLIDANWAKSTEVVYKLCRASRHAAQLMPSHGHFYGASTRSMAERKKGRGERKGINWYISPGKGRVRHVVWDTNWWKTFHAARLTVPVGDPSAITLWGPPGTDHRMLADQLVSERPYRTEGRGRVVDEWKLKRVGLDNHFTDTQVGNCVAASILGVSLEDQLQPRVATRRRVTQQEMRSR